MYELFVEEHFDAAHFLPEYHGKCEQLHGHRFKVVMRVEGADVGTDGMVYDFAAMKRHLRETLAVIDHSCLNEAAPFANRAPSSENIAAWLYEELGARLGDVPIKLTEVEVWESPTSGVKFRP
jgi:6-pyruvoyltetrahydropterin/6-carboxytetrahydropterin synthase